MTIPAFINPDAGKGEKAREALAKAGPIDIRETDDLARQVREVVEGGATRVIVAGGDGSVAGAAAIIGGSDVALGIVPAGTLNHLAKDLGIPLDLEEAARLAAAGDVTTIDIGRAGEHVFINTSSLGAYVVFVRTRERLERWLGYWAASVVASMRVLIGMRLFTVEIEVEGEKRRYRTPLVFVGVGERELKVPKLGGRVEGGRRGLHVLVVHRRTGARLFVLALAAAARGLESVAHGPAVDAFLVDRCRIELPRRSVRIALDGEIVATEGPVEYALWRDALRVVVPTPANLEKDSRAG